MEIVSQPMTEDRLLVPITEVEVQSGFNVREDTQPETELIESIRQQGILTPLQTRWKDPARTGLFIIDGERRYNAAKQVGLEEVPVVNRGSISDKQALLISLSTNEGQKPLTRHEKARGFKKLVAAGFTAEEIAQTMGFSTREVEETLRLMDKAIPKIKRAAMQQSIPTRVASRAATLPKVEQEKLAPKLKGKNVADGLNEVRKVEKQLGVTTRGRKVKKLKLVSNVEKCVRELEEMVVYYVKQSPKNKVFKGYYALIQVLKGEQDKFSLFPETKKKTP